MKIDLHFLNKDSKETLWSLLSKGSALILFLCINILLARALGVEDYGLWSLFISVMTIVFTISYFGINASAKKFVAQHNKTESLRAVLLDSFKLRVAVSIGFSLLLFIFHKPLSLVLGYPELAVLFLHGSPLVLLSGLVEYFKSVFAGLHRIRYNFIVNIVEYGLKLLLILSFLYFAESVIGVVYSYTLALLVTMIVGLYLLYVNFYRKLEKNALAFRKDVLQYSYPLIFISLGFVALTEIDTVMLGIYADASEVGIYAVAKQMIVKLPHIAIAIAMGTMPIFAKLNRENRAALRIKLNKLLKMVAALYAVIVLAIIAFANVLVVSLFGAEYLQAVLPMQILSVYLFFYALSVILSTALDYVGKAKKRAINISATIVLNIVLNAWLIPRYGAAGAAIATTLSYLPYVFLNWWEVRRSFI